MEIIIAIIVWLISFIVLPQLENKKKVNLVQRLNFGSINALLILFLITTY